MVEDKKNVARYLWPLILAGILALLVAGCQSETTGANIGDDPDATKQTLGLVEDLVANCDDMLEKLAGREKDYANAGDARGEQLMGEAANDVKDIKDAANDIPQNVAPDVTNSATAGETTSISPLDPADRPPSAQENIQEIYEARDHLEDNLAEAQSCCGLDPDFLDENLEKLRTQTTALEEQVDQIEPERTLGPERSAQEQYDQ